ncbi:nuclear transport factor 2 family protein [Duganella sp. BJB488]|uniref:nuclear transport factor 2 family protein n=1 Tax=unclassified Duganella TaxID=2636909 RepID=UPI000E354BB2|nr:MULTISPECIES: nuclear transport factor 2 family protein [unclassified Duganella]RFP21729.1 nuclear transport factor 2 family protein [Duganella sp. BJB489]RFP23521.1 nuclear transport factor 2 family protein [Duganella sp. BJB488]RFP38688.1 nuclear transport factor 2 family protein [Duganella sp. BJB480]
MKFKSVLMATIALASLQLHAQEAAPRQQLLKLVQAYTEAQRDFEPSKIDAIVTRDFYEVSPIGEVDPREKVLGFYLPANKREAPTMEVSEPSIQVFGNTGTILVKLSGSATVNAEKRNFAFRAGYVAVNEGGKWKLASAQYTGIRPPKPQ